MEDYVEIPKDTKKIILERYSCGLDCNCNSYKLYAIREGNFARFLWESNIFNPDDWISIYFPDEMIIKEQNELAGEVNMALAHYGIKHAVEVKDFWDWETEFDYNKNSI